MKHKHSFFIFFFFKGKLTQLDNGERNMFLYCCSHELNQFLTTNGWFCFLATVFQTSLFQVMRMIMRHRRIKNHTGVENFKLKIFSSKKSSGYN